jgi:hypothetical protein
MSPPKTLETAKSPKESEPLYAVVTKSLDFANFSENPILKDLT